MKNFYLILLCVLVAGCQSLLSTFSVQQQPIDATTPDGQAVTNQLASLVSYAEWLSGQESAALLPVYRQVERDTDSPGTPIDLVKLAMILSVPGTGFQDEARAMQLLTAAHDAAAQGDGDLHDFIRLQQLGLRARSQINLGWQKQLDREKSQLKTVQKQLDELKSIEKGLLERRESFD